MPEPRPVYLGDTLGELRKFYALADVVFVGRSLVAMGGSDVMEVAALAKPIVVGPHTQNFTDAVERLRRSGGLVQVKDVGELHQQIAALLANPGLRERMGAAARETIVACRGATGRTVDRILETADMNHVVG